MSEAKQQKEARAEALKTVGKASQPGSEKEQKNIRPSHDTLLSNMPIVNKIPGIRHPEVLITGLAVHSIHKSHKNKQIMEQHKALQKEYEKLSHSQTPSFGTYYERARNEVKRERLEKRVDKIKRAQERSAKIGRLIGATMQGVQQMTRMNIQRDTYNSVRADTSGALRKDLPLIASTDNLDTGMDY